MKGKKIAVDARMLFSSGIGVVIRNVLKRWTLPSGIILVANRESVDWCREALPGWEVRFLKSKIYSIYEQIELPMHLRDVSVLWSPHYNVPILFYGKLVVTIHDVLHLVMPEYFPGFLKQFYANRMIRTAIRKANKLICVSEFTSNEIQRKIGCSDDKFEVVHNGVDSEWFFSNSKYNSKEYFIYVGNIKPHKNLKRLLAAFELVVDVVDVDLLIVGNREGFITGDYGLIEEASRLGDRVSFTGQVSDQRLRELVGGATAMVFPSLYEGFGLPPLEAMASGVPVVASEIASIPEVCGPGVLYFDPYDIDSLSSKMISVTQLSDVERRQLVDEGRSWARQFTWEKASADVCHIISQLC